MDDQRPTVSIIGMGAFGRLAAEHLSQHADVVAHDPGVTDAPSSTAMVDLAAAASREIVVLAVPVQHLAEVCDAISPHLQPGAIVLDVCSVKGEPCRVMAQRLPEHCQIIGTHPLFGPQTARECGTIANQTIALCPVRADTTTIESVRTFLADALNLKVVEVSPDEHDRQMALVQVITHLVGHAAAEMDLPELPLATLAYTRVLQLKANTQGDSPELFAAIQTHNPYAADTRRRFFEAMSTIIDRAEGLG